MIFIGVSIASVIAFSSYIVSKFGFEKGDARVECGGVHGGDRSLKQKKASRGMLAFRGCGDAVRRFRAGA